MSRPWTVAASGLRVSLRVTPNATHNRIEGVETRSGIGTQLRVRVRDVPDKGRANAAVLRLLADALAIPASRLMLVSGETARDKVVDIDGDPAELGSRLEALVEADKRGARS